MKEKLYAIPVNDAFSTDCECPVCFMFDTLERSAIEYTMGPSYMEDDTRALTDKKGFCKRHMEMIYASGNKLGISLILKTHFDHVISQCSSLSEKAETKKKLFSKENDIPAICAYLDNLNSSCFVCDRIYNVFDRYIDTIFHLYKTDSSFAEKYSASKGFCNEHFSLLIKKAPSSLNGAILDDFLSVTRKLYIDNMERVRDDLAWFIDKFDYKNSDAPWKNSKDSIRRAIIKTNGIIQDDM